jgi:hypothetical protein
MTARAASIHSTLTESSAAARSLNAYSRNLPSVGHPPIKALSFPPSPSSHRAVAGSYSANRKIEMRTSNGCRAVTRVPYPRKTLSMTGLWCLHGYQAFCRKGLPINFVWRMSRSLNLCRGMQPASYETMYYRFGEYMRETNAALQSILAVFQSTAWRNLAVRF